MKRTLITIAAVSALCSAANAQGRKGLWISPSASLGVGTMADAYVPAPGFDTKFSVNFAIGAEASYMFTDNIGAGTGINFAGYGYLFRAEDGGDKMDYIGSQAFLEIPVFFRFVAGRGGNGFFTNVGFINGFMAGSEQKFELNGNETDKVSGSESNRDFNSFAISPFVYFGGNIRCGQRVQLTLGPQFSYQVTNNFSNSSGLNGHYFNIAFKVGVGIHALRR